MNNIIIRAVVTEKATNMNEDGKYVFIVDKNANKLQIKEAVEQMYNVSVEAVNTVVYQGKTRTKYTKTKVLTGRRPSFKKAYVTVKEGEFIDVYGNV
ncbi:MAG: 50S ribosomal protein L23 [Thermonemataceae bacterium]